MPINPITKIDGSPIVDRGDFNADLSMQDVSDILTKFPTNLDVGGSEKENTQAILFKFHNPIPGQIDPKHPSLQGNNKYIALPIPAELPFTDSYAYDDSGSLQDYGTWIKNMITRAKNNIGGMASLDGADLANRKAGIEANSQAAVTFKSPNFRTFTFSWELVAKDEFEAGVIHTIVQKFRIAAASAFQDGNAAAAYLEYPDLVSFIVYTGNDKFPFPASHPCFIESVTFPPISHEGQIPLFKDNAPVGFRLGITLKESMYIDKNEIAPGWGQQGF